jgi:hypothetical protein
MLVVLLRRIRWLGWYELWVGVKFWLARSFDFVWF